MGRFIIKRTGHALLTMFVVSIIVFMIVRLSGDPVEVLVPDEAPAEDYEEMRKYLRLDEHITVQYYIWMSKVLQGDLGESTTQRIPVATLVSERFPATLQLTSLAFAFTLILGLPIGVYAAAHRGSPLDLFARGFAAQHRSALESLEGPIVLCVEHEPVTNSGLPRRFSELRGNVDFQARALHK